MSSNQKPQGGILRSRSKAKKSTNGHGDRSGHVTFSSNNETSTFPSDQMDDDDEDEIDDPPRQNNEYDSDDDDAILASGEGLLMKGGNNADEEDEMDEAFHSEMEIEKAKRRRGDARHQTSGFDESTTSNDRNLSLITDQTADPDEYQSNAGINASCPVEPFNMDSEKEGGLGYFDGDTYIFRKNKVEGEEDAWLDGFEDENEEDANATKGGLDSMSIWKPKDGNKNDSTRKSSKYVKDGETQEEIGARLVALLENDDTVMMALTRHGATLRQLQSQEQKLAKKNGMKKRKAKPDAASAEQSTDKENEMDQLKMKIKQTREAVEELTELADALLFEGETDAYELTKADWTHRFKLDGNRAKRPTETLNDGAAAKKPRHNYFGETSTTDTTIQNDVKTEQDPVMWEYKGNEDGVIHGPYTSRQMLEWTSCGYFVGASAVDIRQVGSGKTEEAAKSDADDLMADLMDDEGDEKKESTNEWMRSDAVDFNAYL